MEKRTQEQLFVVKMLEEEGCEVKPGVDRKGYVEFKPLGASSFGAVVFPNGNVYIQNTHWEPFESQMTSYYEIARSRMGCAKFSAYWKEYVKDNDLILNQRVKKATEAAAKIEVRLDDEATPTADKLWMLAKARVERTKIEDFYAAIENGDMGLTDTNAIVSWLHDPPSVWRRRYQNMLDAKSPEDYDMLKQRLKWESPAIVQAQEYPSHRIGWLDVDNKSNEPDRMRFARQRLLEDDRVAGVFTTISGGLAIGVGIYAVTQSEYVQAMTKACEEIERDYALVVDRTCLRWSQLRFLAMDETAVIKPSARHFRSNTMNLEELQAISEKITAKAEASAKKSKRDVRAENGLLDELAYAVRKLEISVCEDRWTGKRTYKLKGKEEEKIDPLLVAIKDLELRDNNNCWRINKDDMLSYLTSVAVEYRDVVKEEVFNGEWDGVERWDDLKAALHLDDFGLMAFKLWFRQGVGLLENTGRADDLQRNFMLILYSKNQSIGKSHLVRLLSCGTNSFTQKNLDIRSKDTLADLYSHWIHEFGELGTTFRRKDINDLKNYVTNTSVAIRRPYDRDATTYPVRTSIIGTTNDSDLFTDDTGNRRYIVIDCKWTRNDWPAINALDVRQLWLQAKFEYEHERVQHTGRYPYLMSAEFQMENDLRCKSKMVKTREMYLITQTLLNLQPADAGTDGAPIQRDDGEIVIVMSLLLQQFDAWQIRTVNDYNVKRALKYLGFREFPTIADTLYFIAEQQYEDLLQTVKSTKRVCNTAAPLSEQLEQARVLQQIEEKREAVDGGKKKKTEKPHIIDF